MNGIMSWRWRTLRRGPILAGWELDCYARLGVAHPGAGVAVELLGGGALPQRAPGHPDAPLDMTAESFELELQGVHEDDWIRTRELLSYAQHSPVEVVVELVRPDVWLIPTSVRTTWHLSRPLPFGLAAVDVADYMPEARTVDFPPTSPSTDTPVEVLTAGTPAGEQLLVATDTNARTVTTGDLTAHAGRALVFVYQPLRLVVVDSYDDEVAEPNAFDYSIGLREVVLPIS